ncbi:MAG: hypothetical protein FJ399_22030, partial [Verrucomicrobia bacterium]|nr:hypothetical protein [Verrucomicrobiota bacterium]
MAAAGGVNPVMTPEAPRRVRLCYFNAWADGCEEAVAYLARVPTLDLAPKVSHPRDPELLRKARLDCDWYAENTRCFAAVEWAGAAVLPAWVTGPAGVLEVARRPWEAGEERWFVTMGQQPQVLRKTAGRVFALLAHTG